MNQKIQNGSLEFRFTTSRIGVHSQAKHTTSKLGQQVANNIAKGLGELHIGRPEVVVHTRRAVLPEASSIAQAKLPLASSTAQAVLPMAKHTGQLVVAVAEHTRQLVVVVRIEQVVGTFGAVLRTIQAIDTSMVVRKPMAIGRIELAIDRPEAIRCTKLVEVVRHIAPAEATEHTKLPKATSTQPIEREESIL